MKIIDVHHHMLPQPYRDYITNNRYPTAMGGALPPWSPQQSLDLMDQSNIDYSVLSITETGIFFGNLTGAKKIARQCNDFCAELIQKFPRRFGGFAVIPLPDIDGSIKEATYALNVLKMHGITLSTNIDGRHLGDPFFEPFFQALNNIGAVVYVHPVIPPGIAASKTALPSYLVDTVSDTTRTIASLLYYGTLNRYKNIRWIFAHGGGTIPFLIRRLEIMELSKDAAKTIPGGIKSMLSNTFFDTGLVGGPGLLALQAAVPSSQILFGTDFPFAPPSFIKSFADELSGSLSPEVLNTIQYRNSSDLLPGLLGLASSAA